jgi:hypothetical protein
MTLVISEAPHALDLTGGRVLGRGETANVNLSNSHEAAYYDEGWLTIIDGSSPPPPPTPPESIQVAGSPFQTGQVIYYNGLEWVVLNPGDAGEVLMTHGVNAIPEWVPIDVSMFAFDPATQSELDVHAADTTAVHGIANTADILYKTLADAKGDIFVATAPDTLSRLPVGSDNTFLKANSAQPAGVEWASVPSPDLTPYAPKASPSFTGTIGLPTYTLATRPLASVGAGKAIYVSDAAQGQKFQTSDGSVWSTVAVVLDALSASTPDRIAWEFPAGTDIVEVWADRTAAGQVLTHIDQMNSAGPYVGNSPGGAFDSAYVSGGVMTIPSNVNRYLYRTDWGLFADTDRTEVLFKAVGALPLNLTGLFNWHQASNTYMGIGIVNTGAVINGIGGSAPQLLAPVALDPSGQQLRLGDHPRERPGRDWFWNDRGASELRSRSRAISADRSFAWIRRDCCLGRPDALHRSTGAARPLAGCHTSVRNAHGTTPSRFVRLSNYAFGFCADGCGRNGAGDPDTYIHIGNEANRHWNCWRIDIRLRRWSRIRVAVFQRDFLVQHQPLQFHPGEHPDGDYLHARSDRHRPRR